jgi:alpha-glucuronidase
MAWDPDAKASAIAIEWIRQTFSNDQQFVEPVSQLMLTSRQHLVDYMTPLGLVHLMGTSHHYGPAPWVDDLNRDDWEPFYFHRADRDGIGFDRTTTGSNAVAQYFSDMQAILGDRKRIPDDLLLFFHRVGWDEKLRSGRTLWEELVYRYSRGVDGVARMRKTWQAVEGRIDRARYTEVAEFLKIQHYEARWWRDACLLYFARQSGHAIPSGYAAPVQALSFYQALACPIDSTKPRCEAVYRGEPSPAILE